jgi:hypothetical protein
MKYGEYSVVEQLKRTPARISFLSMILSFEPHQKALQKVLNDIYKYIYIYTHTSRYQLRNYDTPSKENLGFKLFVLHKR